MGAGDSWVRVRRASRRGRRRRSQRRTEGPVARGDRTAFSEFQVLWWNQSCYLPAPRHTCTRRSVSSTLRPMSRLLMVICRGGSADAVSLLSAPAHITPRSSAPTGKDTDSPQHTVAARSRLLEVAIRVDDEEAAQRDARGLDEHAVVRRDGLGLVRQDWGVCRRKRRRALY